MNITVMQGNIVHASTDYVCSSTNPHLELMAGTGAALRDAGGPNIQAACRERIADQFERTGKRFFESGAVVVTPAGTLPFQAVCHCVAIDGFHDSSTQFIQSCTAGVLQAVVERSPEGASVAMPIFATGHGRFDFEASCKAMIAAIRQSPHAKQVRVVLVVRDREQVARIESWIKSENL